MKNEILVLCSSCHIDYEKQFTKEVELQGETFCIDCWNEWDKEKK